MDQEQVIKRRRLTIDDAFFIAPILGRQEDIARQLVRVFQTGDIAEGTVLIFRMLPVLPELVSWLAELYGMDEQTLRKEPIEHLPLYIRELIRGDDWRDFLRRLSEVFGAT